MTDSKGQTGQTATLNEDRGDLLAKARGNLQASTADERYMLRALELARLGYGKTSPNPNVGAVIVKNGAIIGEGFHRAIGKPHAEVEAFASLTDPASATGATLYVTLEPCCHQGRTPPCTDAILKAGIARVVVATPDPDSRVNGGGLAKLIDAGVRVELGLCEEEAVRLNAGFLMHRRHGRPFTTAKWAMTLDGRIAATSGDSIWISNDASRQLVHQMRARVDAVMVGIGTVLRDNPRLNARVPDPEEHQPLRVVIDGRLRTPFKANVIDPNPDGPAGPTLIITTNAARKENIARFEDMGVDIEVVSGEAQGMMDIEKAMQALGRRNIQTLLLEGGGQLNGSMMEEGLIDEVVAFIAPKIIGGWGSSNPIEGFGRDFMKDAVRLRHIDTERLGDDLCMRGYIEKAGALEGLITESEN